MPKLSKATIGVLRTTAAAAILLLFPGLSLSNVFGRTAAGFGIHAPRAVATGTPIPLRGEGARPGETIELERLDAGQWRHVASLAADTRGRFSFTYRSSKASRRYVFRARGSIHSEASEARVRSRDVTLTAVGDVNLGDGPAQVMRARGPRWPWRNVAPTLRRSDIALANLECSVSNRGSRVPKEFNFRGKPSALRIARRFAGLDVVSLANNHSGDYGQAAMLDTLRNARRSSLVPIGAGHGSREAYASHIVTALGLRVAFLGFSDIGPASFFAGSRKPGTAYAEVGAIRRSVRRAKRHAEIVVTMFHWGVERQTAESARQRVLAHAALAAGATAVIGAHPHVLQPTRRVGKRRVVAYSLGNFVWSAGSPPTSRTGILKLRLSAQGVVGVRFLRAAIVDSQPRLTSSRRSTR